jgi:peroxiredoxin Q/BCP
MTREATMAPAFTLPDQDSVVRSLADYRGKWVVLYFYPRDESLNCTVEACTFRDEYRIISQFGAAEVIGVNKGSVASHKRFAERFHLNFPILSDSGHSVTKAYGAWKVGLPRKLLDMPFSTRRNTYIIDPEGMIAKQYVSVNPNDHAAEVISDLQALQKARKKARRAMREKQL